MSRVLNKPIDAAADPDDKPSSFTWGARWLQVAQVLERWRDTGCWWDGEGEKLFYRLLATDGGVYELYNDLRMQKWYLYRVLD